VVGLMGLDRPEIGWAFTPDQVNMAVTIGAQAAFAIENARLYQETARRLTEAQTLQEVSAAAVSILDFDEILERVIQILRSRLGVEYVGLAVPTEDGAYLVSDPAMHGREPRSEQAIRLPVNKSVKGRVFRTGEVALIRDVNQEPEYVARTEDVRSELAVPVRAGGEVVAVLSVESRRRDAFDEGDLAFYMAIAGQLGIALENARLYRQEQQRRREAETLYRAAQALTTTLDLREVLDRILTELQQVVPYDSASVQLLEDSRLEIIGGRGFPNLDELLGLSFDISQEGNPNREVVRARSPLILSDAPLHYAGFRREPHAAAAIRAWMGVPLLYGDRLIGMLALDKHEPGFYSREHARVALVFAGQAAIAIENAQLYRRLSQALRELQDLGRLREEVVQNVSHELRTPLALIQGYTELLLSGDLGQVQPAQRSALEVIQDRTVTLARLIYNLTALRSVPRELLAMMPISIGELLQSTLANHRRPAARAGVKLASDLAGELPLVLGDREYLSVVFSHLIDNAIKFSPDGGLVRVRAWADEESVHVAVRDQGIGIASEHLSRIFERFYQADGSTTRRFGGMGIGLALVWEIVEAHRGSVMVESEQGKGSTFVVSLPQAEEQLT
jgi:signal transduction histidine kinase